MKTMIEYSGLSNMGNKTKLKFTPYESKFDFIL